MRHRRELTARPARLALLLALAWMVAIPRPAWAAVKSGQASSAVTSAETSESGTDTLEQAASRAGNTGRAVAMSLIGLALAVAGTVLAFRRDFKEAAGVFVIGIVAILLATPAGVSLLRDTVSSIFGGS
jgi:hypothetical protein